MIYTAQLSLFIICGIYQHAAMQFGALGVVYRNRSGASPPMVVNTCRRLMAAFTTWFSRKRATSVSANRPTHCIGVRKVRSVLCSALLMYSCDRAVLYFTIWRTLAVSMLTSSYKCSAICLTSRSVTKEPSHYWRLREPPHCLAVLLLFFKV